MKRMFFLIGLCAGMLSAVDVSDPIIKKPVNIDAVKDPLEKMEKIQIGLTGANTQVFDRPNLVLDPPSQQEFARWTAPFDYAISAIRKHISSLDPLCDMLIKINDALRNNFAIMYAEKESLDEAVLERYRMLFQAVLDRFKAVDNTFQSFSSTYRKKLNQRQQSLDDDIWSRLFGSESEDKKIAAARSALVLTQVLIETFRAIITKVLNKDLKNAAQKFELDLRELK
jgi:hypothetical protein